MIETDRPCPGFKEAPLVTAHIQGVGGAVRQHPEDFRVEELPLYDACGDGEHLYLTIEKRGVTTIDMVARVARALGVKASHVGYAGMKDAQAITTQRISIAGVEEAAVAALDLPGIQVLECRRHRNKLKKGHLAGNRFRIWIRDVREGAEASAKEVLSILRARGVPNGFGPQRFGNRGDTHALGRGVLLGDGRAFFRALLSSVDTEVAREKLLSGDVAGAVAELPESHRIERKTVQYVLRSGGDLDRALTFLEKPFRSLYLSALQSALFNELLCRRFETYDQVQVGDLAWLHRNGAVFVVEDLEREAPRALAHEISPSGPLFGAKVTIASPPVGDQELGVLAGFGLEFASFAARRDLPGVRRPFRVPLTHPEVRAAGGDLEVSFALPPGSYATVVLRELQEGLGEQGHPGPTGPPFATNR